MTLDEMIAELNRMHQQYVCPKDTFFADIARVLHEQEVEIERLRGILGEVREVDRMHAEDEWARRKDEK